MSRRLQPHKLWFTLALAVFLGTIGISTTTVAGPVTNPGVAPYSRLSVYEGVMSVVPPAGGVGVLELGYRGEEIAGSSDIYFRPGSVTQANGARLCTNCGTGVNPAYANLVVTGQVCLYGPAGTTADCRSVWPSGGAGSSYWEYVTDNDLYGNPGMKYIQPNPANASRAIHIGSAAVPVGGIALQVDDYGGLLARNSNAGAKGLTVTGNVRLYDTTVKEEIRVNGQPVYNNENSGVGSGLDADRLDGRDITIEPGSSCVDRGGPRMACLCVRVKENTSYIKKCTALANHAL